MVSLVINEGVVNWSIGQWDSRSCLRRQRSEETNFEKNTKKKLGKNIFMKMSAQLRIEVLQAYKRVFRVIDYVFKNDTNAINHSTLLLILCQTYSVFGIYKLILFRLL